MSWQENESWNAGEEWKGDNYQSDNSYDPADINAANKFISNLCEIFERLAQDLIKAQENGPRELTEEEYNRAASENMYVLDGEIVRKARCYGEAMAGFKNNQIEYINLGNGCSVSTIFLIFDHSHDNTTPILFETMGWYKDSEFCQKRYATYEAAITGHREAVDELKIAIENEL